MMRLWVPQPGWRPPGNEASPWLSHSRSATASMSRAPMIAWSMRTLGCSVLADGGEHGPDGHDLVLLHEQRSEHARHGRRDLGVDLVGLDQADGVIDLDALALVLQPLDERRVEHGQAPFGQDHGRLAHSAPPCRAGMPG